MQFKGKNYTFAKPYFDGLVQIAVTPVRKQWSYCSFALSHRFVPNREIE